MLIELSSTTSSEAEIFFAWDDEPWVLEGASVRISIVGFDDGSDEERRLDGLDVANINSDLTAKRDLTKARTLSQNASIAFLGDCKGGPFDITEPVARVWLDAPVNPNGRPNSDVVHRRVNGQDIVGCPRQGWIVDFGPKMKLEDAALYELPFEYVQRCVKPVRDQNRDNYLRLYWWLHQRPRPELRNAINSLFRFIVTPAVSKHRLFVWIESGVVPDHKLIAIAREDDYFFGVLH